MKVQDYRDPSAERFLRVEAVCDRVGSSRATLYREISLGRFPPPVKIFGKRASAWLESEVNAFVASRIAARDKANG